MKLLRIEMDTDQGDGFAALGIARRVTPFPDLPQRLARI
jgi:hypothetical protein